MHGYILTRVLFSVIAVWVVLGGLTLFQNAALRQRIALTIAVFLCFAGALRYVANTIIAKVRNPPSWDVGIYWTWGRVALISHRVYDPASSVAIGLTVARDEIWRQEVIARGFLYPPTTILLFAPLGLFRTYQSATPWWYAANVTALVLAIALLWRIYFRKHGLIGLLATAALVLAFPATAQTLFTGQPMTIALLLVTLYAAAGPRLRGGLWLGLAFIVKPLALVLFLDPLCRRRFAQAGAAAATVAGASMLTVLLLGWQNVLPYFTNGPDRRYSAAVLLDPQRSPESLLSAVAYLSRHTVANSLFQEPLFLLCAAAMTLTTIVLCVLLKDRDNNSVTLSLLIPLSLLVYPPTSLHYNDLLLISIFTLWSEFESARPVAAVLFISAIYGLLVTWTVVSFLGPLLLWLTFAGLAIQRTRRALSLRPA